MTSGRYSGGPKTKTFDGKKYRLLGWMTTGDRRRGGHEELKKKFFVRLVSYGPNGTGGPYRIYVRDK